MGRLSSTSPIFTFLLTFAVARLEPGAGRKLFGVVAGLAGICLIGVVLGVAFFGETLTPTAWIGLVCVVIGVAAMTVPPRKDVVLSRA